MKKILSLFICIFMLLPVGCKNEHSIYNSPVSTPAITPTPSSKVIFGSVGLSEEHTEALSDNLIKAASLEDIISKINSINISKITISENAKETLQRVKNNNFILFPFFDGNPAEIETLSFYVERGTTPAHILMNCYSDNYCFRIYVYYLDSNEVEATKEFGANGFFKIAEGVSLEEMQQEKKILDSPASITVESSNVNVEKYTFDNCTFTKIPLLTVLSEKSNVNDILIKETEKYQMAEYVLDNEFMIRVYGGLKTENWTNTINLELFEHLTIEKVPLQKQ